MRVHTRWTIILQITLWLKCSLIIVPIFDGRDTHFELNDVLKLIGKNLPLLDEEIPVGSFALIAYTANAYKRKGSASLTNIALNINWAVLLAIPK